MDPIAVLDTLRGTSVVALDFHQGGVIPASALSHHTSLTRLYFFHSEMPPLRDLAGLTQLHGLRELVCYFGHFDPPRHQLQLQHSPPLSQLEVLDIDGMQIAGADAGLAALTRLRELRLENSDLRAVPASMASLARLTRLTLNASWDLDLAGGWQHLPLQLEVLNLSFVGVAAVSPELTRLTCLTQLDLAGNLKYEDGLDVALPTTLHILDISHNSRTVVPAALARLTGLRVLYTDANPLAGGWQHLAGMKQLEELSLNNCGLTAVPEVLSQLTALTSIDVSDNPIASGWQHLSLLQLNRLQADDDVHRIYKG